MADTSPKAQICGGRAAPFANALRATRSTFRSFVPIRSLSHLFLRNLQNEVLEIFDVLIQTRVLVGAIDLNRLRRFG